MSTPLKKKARPTATSTIDTPALMPTHKEWNIIPKPETAMTKKDCSRYWLQWDEADREAAYSTAMSTAFEYIDEHGQAHLLSCLSLNGKGPPQVNIKSSTGRQLQVQTTHAATFKEGPLSGSQKLPTHWFCELSHLCGLKICLRHVLWELPWENIWRDGCHKYRHFAECPHDPKCLVQPNIGRALEAARAESTRRAEEKDAMLTEAQRERKEKTRAKNARYAAKNREVIRERNKKNKQKERGTEKQNIRDKM